MATWPTQLDVPLVEGYGLEPVQAFARTDMDQGPARQRRRSRSTPTMVPVQFLFDQAQMAIFEAWYEHDADSGAGWFYTQIYNGKGLVTVDARFSEVWKASAAGALLTRISAKWEVRTRPILTATELAAATGG